MKDIFKIVLLLIILILMVGGFWYLFKINKVFDNKNNVNETKEVSAEKNNEDVEQKDSSTEEKIETKKEVKKAEQKKTEEKKEVSTKIEKKEEKKEEKIENKNDNNTSPKEETEDKEVDLSTIKVYEKPRCVFTGEEDKYSYLMTYVGYFDHSNNDLMDKISIKLQYNAKDGVNIEDVNKEAQEDIKEHVGFSSGFRIIDRYVIVNLEGDAKAFSKVYLDEIVDNIDINTFKSVFKSAGATCYVS